MMPRLIPAALFAVAALLSGCGEQPADTLPALGAQRDATSVSGISSGAYMAGQFQFAHGQDVIGAGIIAGGPYGCSQSVFADLIPGPGMALLNLNKAINGCMLNALQAFGVPDPELLAQRAERLAEKGRIDPISATQSDRIYLFSGKNDSTVVPAIVEAANKFYAEIGVPKEQIEFVSDMPAGHAFVTVDRGAACDYTGKPYIVDCDYDQAGALLRHIYGALNAPAADITGRFLLFDQERFTDDLSNHGMDDEGLAYIPKSCEGDAACRVHIAFHGCGQNRTFVGDTFARDSGFARWADTNNLIILFPQTSASPLNPQGCWDWWGFTGSDYLTRDAPQITAVHRMLERLASPQPSS
ncbi:poly (3-hydroxybutyrate) depolymerase [Hyphomicrobium sulfonivorans]|uniref:Poly (3-hydroxybutyrate) depolymerase n=1 Tax=Hyphomicrobium sulfonivorans TaxID=121290 RepID=A0A120CV84_HYPSL|nr:poly(3-hydroxybutyrate) depolymerase [Hyphomicrobium sulfonivorans]KWT67394.1 poly (3-hydroxybutyrate) depolymerase [Hyphomicrobium sulfonivorans]